MPELGAASVSVVRCLARREALDSLVAPDGALPCRVAPDELLLLGPEESGDEILAACARHLEQADPSGLALDHDDAFAAWALTGPGAEDVFARLSAIRLPEARPAFLQGAVGGVAAKVVVEPERILVLVSSTFGHHLRDRFEEATG